MTPNPYESPAAVEEERESSALTAGELLVLFIAIALCVFVVMPCWPVIGWFVMWSDLRSDRTGRQLFADIVCNLIAIFTITGLWLSVLGVISC